MAEICHARCFLAEGGSETWTKVYESRYLFGCALASGSSWSEGTKAATSLQTNREGTYSLRCSIAFCSYFGTDSPVFDRFGTSLDELSIHEAVTRSFGSL